MRLKLPLASALFIASAALGSTLLTALPAHAQTFDATADFVSPFPNPNGVWRYGYTTTLGGAFIQHAEFVNDGSLAIWRTNISSGTPAWFKNISAVNQINGSLAPGQAALHGGPNGEFAVLRFTTPTAGTYNLSLQYFTGDTGNTDAYLLRAGNAVTPLFTDLSTTGGGTFALNNLNLSQNETIDLAIGNGGDGFLSDTTPVNLRVQRTAVTSAPEPGTLALVALAALPMGGIVLRRRRKA